MFKMTSFTAWLPLIKVQSDQFQVVASSNKLLKWPVSGTWVLLTKVENGQIQGVVYYNIRSVSGTWLILTKVQVGKFQGVAYSNKGSKWPV